jgi:hypothetical protein
MKRFLSIILSFLYISLSTSAAISIHYCGGELESISINSYSEGCCCGSSEMSRDCCKDESLVLKLDTDQTITSVQNILPEQIIILSILTNQFELLKENGIDFVCDNYFVPHPKLQPIWLMNCTFTFYG